MADKRIITNPAGAATLKKYNLNFDKLNKKGNEGLPHYSPTGTPLAKAFQEGYGKKPKKTKTTKRRS